ncbi:hypothetical protein JYK14_23785 [Siccirubricoccus sp. KC 17139]|uniref:Uncharacterized protein n=1 Tax=Siccirubricoccus soli TaxID=2899147 RepID=A0ABT1DB38_9PROT|nr:hypothetical protein [Siccirubricoccus soli]MCO6419158.1 hypothetical protein [Siccirubricoccus soli]MCP2685293.1 hypothetical protein [Siccirubricoccus soli]
MKAKPMLPEADRPHLPRRSRRLPDTILAAVHRACDEGRLDLAGKLLAVGEEAMAAEADLRRRRQDIWGLIAAYERLWHLRQSAALAPEALLSGRWGFTAGLALAAAEG